MIVDFHCHAGRGDGLTGPWDTDAPLESYLARARAASIDRVVVFPAFHSDYAVANAELARLVQRQRGKPGLIGFAFVNTLRDRGRVSAMLHRAALHFGFQGVKVHGSEGMPTRELCEAARRLRFPVLVDVVGKPDVMDLIAPQYPDVPFVVAHLGSFMDDWRAHLRVIDQMVRHRNVFADTSGVRRFDYLDEAVRRAGPSKLLFGSDGPWLHPGLELHKIRLLGLRPRDEAAVLGGNALRLLRRPLGSLPREAELRGTGRSLRSS
jgi:predicted TIM-barrel fold metal-dependent hydrolase